MSDADLDAILLDKSEYTVEWMITPSEQASSLDASALLGNNAFVRPPPPVFTQQLSGYQVHHVRITEENVHTWPDESPLTKTMNLRLDKTLSGGVKPGDIIWLAQRKKLPEVCRHSDSFDPNL